LDQGGTLQGVVRENGVPLPDHTVSVLKYTAPEAIAEFDPHDLIAITGVDGSYTIPKVPPGSATVRVLPKSDTTPKPSAWSRRDAIIEEGLLTVVDFDFPLMISVVEGMVVVDGQPPAAGAVSLTLTNDLGPIVLSSPLDVNGYYRIENLAAGSSEIEARVVVSEGLTRKQEIALAIGAGTVIRQDFEFPPATTVYGTVQGIGYNERACIAVFRGDLSDTPFTAVNDLQTFAKGRLSLKELSPDGLFQLDALEPGTYTLVAMAGLAQPMAEATLNMPIRSVSKVVGLKAGDAVLVELAIP